MNFGGTQAFSLLYKVVTSSCNFFMIVESSSYLSRVTKVYDHESLSTQIQANDRSWCQNAQLIALLCVLPLTDTTTYSTERSEHFKPCRDKDLAYCLNDGECFVIETLTGSHKHCR